MAVCSMTATAGACVFWDAGDWSDHYNAMRDGGLGDASHDATHDGKAGHDTTGDDAKARHDTATQDSADAATACDGNTSGDPHNCGACGHDCFGQSCEAGLCAPSTLATASFPHGIAIDDVNVYFTTLLDAGGVYAVSLNGGTVSTLAPDQGQPALLTVADHMLYWANSSSGTVSAVSVDPVGSAHAIVTGLQADEPWGIAVVGSQIYWTNLKGATGGSIQSVELDGAPASPVIPDLGQPVSLVVGSAGIVWANFAIGAGSVGRAGLDGGDLTVLASDASVHQPWGIATDSQFAYFTNQASGDLDSIPLDGGSVRILSHGPGPTDGGDYHGCVVVSDGMIYWASYGTGWVGRIGVDGGGRLQLAAPKNPVCVAVDSKSVYFTDYTGNRVLKVAR
jgi:hypothetical protein